MGTSLWLCENITNLLEMSLYLQVIFSKHYLQQMIPFRAGQKPIYAMP